MKNASLNKLKKRIHKQRLKLISTVIITVALFLIAGSFSFNVVCASSKDSTRPVFTSVEVVDNTMQITWKKAKRSKKNKVFIQKGNSKWKYWKTVRKSNVNKKKYSNALNYRIKENGKNYIIYKNGNPYRLINNDTSKTKLIYTGDTNKVYHFVLQSINGKKADKYSKRLAVRTGSEDQIVPQYKNNKINFKTKVEEKTKKELLSKYIYAQYPLLIYRDTKNIKVGVHVFNSKKKYLRTYALNDGSKVTVPKGYYCRVYITNSKKISPVDSIIYHAIIEKRRNNISYLDFEYNSPWLTPTESTVGLAEPQFANCSLVLSCSDSNKYNYKVALYSENDNRQPEMIISGGNGKKDILIPKGVFYRYCVGPKEGMASIDDNEIISLMPQEKPAKRSVNEMRDSKVPSYYNDYLLNKVERIQELSNTSDVQFAFVTDYHYGTGKVSHNVRALLTKIIKETNVDMVFNGGDTWASGSKNLSKEEAISNLQNGANETIPEVPCNWFFALGHHDTGKDNYRRNGIRYENGPYLEASDIQKYIGTTITDYDVTYDEASNYLAYYFDIDQYRFIITNANLSGSGSGEKEYDTNLFLAEALVSMGEKTGIIISHIYFETGSYSPLEGAKRIGNIICKFNKHGKCEYNGSQLADFYDCGGEVAMWISGHNHQDMSSELEDGTPVVVTTTCNAGRELGSLNRDVGTIYENAFDIISIRSQTKMIYFTRIGAGIDRSFSY